MKITVYTIADDKSAFCKDLKAYLKSKNMPFEEKRVDQNRDALSEMLTVSSNFAGVPFTVVEKDDGTKAMLKGFTQSEFDQAMTGSVTPSASVKPMPTTPTPATTTTTTTTTTPTTTPLTPPTMPAMPTAAPMPAEGSSSKAQAELDGILNDLKSKGGVDLGLQPSTPTMPQAPQVPSMPSMPSTPPAPVSTPPPAPAMPSMPPATPATPTMPPVPQAPKIPDFPAK